jgi:hypothetical protein
MNKLRNFLDLRESARMRGDTGLQRAMDAELRNMGYCAPETTQAPEMEMAVPEKPRRGRPPRPRCEHDLLLERCEDCREEGTVEEVA